MQDEILGAGIIWATWSSLSRSREIVPNRVAYGVCQIVGAGLLLLSAGDLIDRVDSNITKYFVASVLTVLIHGVDDFLLGYVDFSSLSSS